MFPLIPSYFTILTPRLGYPNRKNIFILLCSSSYSPLSLKEEKETDEGLHFVKLLFSSIGLWSFSPKWSLIGITTNTELHVQVIQKDLLWSIMDRVRLIMLVMSRKDLYGVNTACNSI